MRAYQLALTCIGLLAAGTVHADFSKQWLVTPRAQSQGPGGQFEAQIFERMVKAGNTSFSIGNIVYLKFPKIEKFRPGDLAEKARVAMGLDKWQLRRTKDAYVYESLWANSLRFVRLYVKEEKSSISYSVALFRTAYMESVIFESELIQRRLAGMTEEQVPWLEKMFVWLDHHVGIPSALAEVAAPVCNNTCLPGDLVCVMAATSCNQAALTQQMANFNKNLAGSNANWANSNKEIARTNDLLKSFLDPSHAFLWAAGSAAGAAVGAIAVSFAVDALIAGGAAIYEAISHEKDEARILERFKTAREVWEKTSLAASDLEKAIDSLLYLKETSKAFGLTREEIVIMLSAEKAQADAKLRHSNRLLDEAMNHNAVCLTKLGAESGALTDFIEGLSILKKRLQDPLSDDAICTDLKKDLSRLLMAEGSLQKARASILGGHDVWLKSWNEENKQAVDDLARSRGKAREINLKTIKIANESKDRALTEQEALRKEWLDKCRADDSNFLGHIPVVGFLIRHAWTGDCSMKFNASAPGTHYATRVKEINNAYDGQLRESEREYNTNTMSANDQYFHNPTMVAELRGYDEWFDQVRAEQACLVNTNACPGNFKQGVMTRFNSLAAKGKRIDEICSTPLKPVPARLAEK